MSTPAKHDDETQPATGLVDRWRRTEPLRLHLYGVAIPLLLLLVGYGAMSDHHSALWLAVLQAALLGGGVEAARTWTVSPATARLAVQEAAQSQAAVLGATSPARAARHVLLVHGIPR